MKIIDTHAHLNDDRLICKLDEVISRAKANGVKRIYNNGDSLPSFEKITNIQKNYPDICFSVLGIHPEFALESDEYFFNAYSYIKEHKNEISAVGEIGLDYHYSKDDELVKKQKQRFIEQINLAKELNLPIVIHSRGADFDTLNIIKENLPPKLDLHCFSGSCEILKEYLKLPIDFHIGIGGVCTFKNAKVINQVLEIAPLSILLTETDCPYLAPVPYRGSDNEPAYIPLIIKKIAEIKNIDEEKLSEVLYDNATKFYGE